MTPPKDSDPAERSPQADADLIRRAAGGDASASRQLVDSHLGRLVAFAYRMLGDLQDAEDVAQEAFLRLWRQAARWRADALVSTWLHQVAHNLCIDRLRRRREVLTDTLPEHADPAPGPASQLLDSQRARLVDAALLRLPERQRSAIVLVHHQDLSNIAAAEILDVSVDALESLLARGRRALRRDLAPRRDELIGEA